MANNSSIININGNKYDTKTGKLLPNSSAPIKTTPATSKGLVMDGVMRNPNSKTTGSSHSPVVSTQSVQKTKMTAMPAKTLHQSTARSKTLNRQAVAQPTVSPKIHSHSKTTTSITKPAMATTGFVSTTSAERTARAETTKKNQLIKKFIIIEFLCCE